MSDRMTGIRLPLCGDSGIADRGRLTRVEMIQKYRHWAARHLEQLQQILNANDDDFIVETYVGVYVRRHREIVK